MKKRIPREENTRRIVQGRTVLVRGRPWRRSGKKCVTGARNVGCARYSGAGQGTSSGPAPTRRPPRGQRPRTCASRVSAVGPKVRTGASKGAEEGKVSADLRQECGLYALRRRGTGHFQPTCASRASAELPQTAARLRPAAPAGTQRSQWRNQRRMIPQVSRSFRCQLCFPPLTSYRSTSVESPSQR